MTEKENRFTRRKALSFRDGGLKERELAVVDEIPVTVFLNGLEIITFLASDDALTYLAAGFLKSEGFVEKKEDILSITVDREKKIVEVEASKTDPMAAKLLERRVVTSGCGKGTTFYHALDALNVKTAPAGPEVSTEEIFHLMKLLHKRSSLYREAGGVHSAALCTTGRIVVFRDDIGRHNAIDKIHGECFLEEIPVGDKILVTTGRVSSEILIKAGKIGVPLLVSRSSPTGLALDLADRAGITVVGLVRGGGLTVFSHPGRVR